jgi:16S rRNA (guanine1207-N2)-methyltransferase
MEAVYGTPPAELAAAAPDALQTSPLIVDSQALEALEGGSLSRFVVGAPPGTLERRYVLAQALRALAAGGELIALAPKDKGGSRLRKELEDFGCEVRETARRHHRICAATRPAEPVGLEAAIAGGGPQIAPALCLWSQPGVFSWDRLDPGSALLLDHLGELAGRGADLGCGVGVLARAALESGAVSEILLVDLDRRAVEAAQRNIADPRALFLQHDLRRPPAGLTDLDFVIMNPPFHAGGAEDRGLSAAFVGAAAQVLRKGGVCRLVANVALPYEALMGPMFASVTHLARAGGYKILEGRK